MQLSEAEARVLEAMAGYGADAFLKVFYQKLGRYYMEPHEKGIRTLFDSVKSQIVPSLNKIDKAREAIKDI